MGRLKASGSKVALLVLESMGLVAALVGGWHCLRLSYWVTLFAHPADFGLRFTMQRLAVLVLFASPLIALLLYTRKIEGFRWRDWRSMILALTIGLTWTAMGLAVSGSAHPDFLDWSEAMLTVAAFAGLVLTIGGILVHRRLERASRIDDDRRTAQT
jgi:hypothetical protein